jgi:hypothetical protein
MALIWAAAFSRIGARLVGSEEAVPLKAGDRDLKALVASAQNCAAAAAVVGEALVDAVEELDVAELFVPEPLLHAASNTTAVTDDTARTTTRVARIPER